jgi:hypothetical protein
VDFIHQDELTLIVKPELVFRIHEYEPTFGGLFLAKGEEAKGSALNLTPDLGFNQTTAENLWAGYGLIMIALLGFSRGSDDGCGECLVLSHTRGWVDSGNIPAGVIITPSTPGKIAPNNHLYREDGGFFYENCTATNRANQVVGHQVGRLLQPIEGKTVKNLPLQGYQAQNPVKGRNSVAGD